MARKQETRHSIETDLAKLAKHLVKRVLSEDGETKVELHEEIDAFKSLVLYYTATKKHKTKDDEKGSFGGFAGKIAGSRNRGSGNGASSSEFSSGEPEF